MTDDAATAAVAKAAPAAPAPTGATGKARAAKKAAASRRSSRGQVIPLRGGFPHTDVGNAERLVQRHGDRLRFVRDMSTWLTWDDSRWQLDSSCADVKLAVIDTVRSMYRAAGDPDCVEDRKSLAEWAIASESRARIDAAVSLGAIQPAVQTRVEELDADPMLLGVRNGTVDLRTGTLRPVRPADLITQQAATDFDPDATCPQWETFLERIQPDADVRHFLQKAAGYCLTGATGEQVMFLAHGRGANGKSVFVETLTTLLDGYAQKAPADLLMSKPSGSDLSNDVARLRGARFVTAVETDEGRRLAEARVKELTGGDRITARFLHKEFFTFKPVAKLWLVTNHRPTISGSDDGIWRRLVTVPFTEFIAPHERDKHLADKLAAELPGILAWAVRGALAWQREGLEPPQAVQAAHRDYRVDQDVFGSFLDECCVVREGIATPSSQLYATYSRWCQDGGHGVVSATKFGRRLAERGFAKVKSGTIKWEGIGLLANGDGLGSGWHSEDPAPVRQQPFPAPIAPVPAGGPEPVPAAPVQRPVLDTCRVCGLPCDPVCEGIHPTCDLGDDGRGEDSRPAPEPPPARPVPAPQVQQTPEPTPEPVQALRAVETEQDAGVVTSRRRRPWTARSTAHITWSSGKGVTDDGSDVELPRSAAVGRFLEALPTETQRVILVGAMPGKNGPGLQAWALGDLPDGWRESDRGHHLDPESLALRFTRPDGGTLEVHRLASWVRDAPGKVSPAQSREAFALLREGLAVVFGRRRVKPGEVVDERAELAPAVLGSPASTGRELLLRSLPFGEGFPVLSAEHRDLLHHTTGQGRSQVFTEDEQAHPDQHLPGLYGYDMRWSYASLCQRITGSGPARLESTDEFAGFAPARYEVQFTVPQDWNHVGLLGVLGEGWPATPGTTWQTWCDARELRLAERWGWKIGQDVHIRQRLSFAPTKATPLRTWAEKLVEVREQWMPAQSALAPVIALARDMVRTVLLAALGSLHGRRQRHTHSLPQSRAAEVPRGVTPHLSGGMLVWETETASAWEEMAHPEWVSQVWAEQRVRLLDSGPKAAQPNVGALHIPRAELVALRTDAVYSSTDPGWTDTGRVGAFRPQLSIAHAVPTPRSLDELLTLRAQAGE